MPTTTHQENEDDFQREDDIVINEANENQEESFKNGKDLEKRQRSHSVGLNTKIELTVEELK